MLFKRSVHNGPANGRFVICLCNKVLYSCVLFSYFTLSIYTFFMLHFFHVASFSYCTISMSHFFYVALFSCCTLYIKILVQAYKYHQDIWYLIPKITTISFKNYRFVLTFQMTSSEIVHAAPFPCHALLCCNLFMLHFVHAALFPEV